MDIASALWANEAWMLFGKVILLIVSATFAFRYRDKGSLEHYHIVYVVSVIGIAFSILCVCLTDWHVMFDPQAAVALEEWEAALETGMLNEVE